MKKGKLTILGSVIAMMLVAVAVGVGTSAYFSDTETSGVNILTSGSLDLKFDGNPASDVFGWVDDPDLPVLQAVFGEFSNMKPGDKLGTQLGIGNFGSMDGVPSLHFANVKGKLKDAITVTIKYGHSTPDFGVDYTAWEGRATTWVLAQAPKYQANYPGGWDTLAWGIRDYALLFGPDGDLWGGESNKDNAPFKWVEHVFGTTTLENAPTYTWRAPSGFELEAGEMDGYWRINFHFLDASGDEYQDKTVSFNIVFGLDQVKP